MFKKTLIISTLFIVFSACSNPSRISNNLIYVMIDQTDTSLNYQNIVKSSIIKIVNLSGLSKDGSSPNGCTIKKFDINSLSDNKSKEAVIGCGSVGLSGDNPLDRNDDIKMFIKNTESILAPDNSKSGTFSQSKIYQNVCRELNVMTSNNQTFTTRRLVIFSDMLENSDLFSIYRSNIDFNNEEKLDEVLQEMEKSDCILPDLSNVEIYIVVSRSEDNDEIINKSAKLWEYIFNSKNVKKINFDSELSL